MNIFLHFDAYFIDIYLQKPFYNNSMSNIQRTIAWTNDDDAVHWCIHLNNVMSCLVVIV